MSKPVQTAPIKAATYPLEQVSRCSRGRERRAATARELEGIPSQQEAPAALASPTPGVTGCWVFTDRVKRSGTLARLIPLDRS